MKSHGGLADVAFVPGCGKPSVDEGNPGGVKLSLPEIKIDRGNLDLGSNGVFKMDHERFFKTRNLPPNKSAASPRDENQNYHYSQDGATNRAIHAQD
jgi:hypothetical protein